MIDILVFVDDNCRSCGKVLAMMRDLEQDDVLLSVRVVHRRKEPALTAQYDVQIVPALFVNGKLCFYGDFTREEIQRVSKKLNHAPRRDKQSAIKRKEGFNMKKPNVPRAVVAGLAGTGVMTMMMLMAPMMGMPEMNIGNMLAEFMGIPVAIGWMAHFMIGTVLAFVYVFIFADRIPGAPWLRGALYGLVPWLVSQIMVNPMMGVGVFASNMPNAVAVVMGSLMGHLVYGATVGAVYRGTSVSPQSRVLH